MRKKNESNESFESSYRKSRDFRFYLSFVAFLFILITNFPLLALDTVEGVLYVTSIVFFFCVSVQLILNDFFNVSEKINKILYLFYSAVLLILIVVAIKIEETYILGFASIAFVVIVLKLCIEFKEEKEGV